MSELHAAKRKMQIVMTLYGALSVDTRVLREVGTLLKNGYDITVLDVDFGEGKSYIPPGVTSCSVTRISIGKRASMVGLLKFWWACFKGLLSRRRSIDIIHAHDLTGLPPAFALALLHPRIKLVYDSHELFPELAHSKLSLLHSLVFLGIEILCGTCVDRLISVSPSILRILSNRIDAPAMLLRNVPDLEQIKSDLGHIPKWQGQNKDNMIRIAYPGRVLVQRGYEILLDAAEILRISGRSGFEFWIIGDGPLLPELTSMVDRRGLEDSFRFLGRVSFGELLSLMCECDIAIALYENTPNNNLGISNKLLEYMMVGIPFIFTNLTQSLPILQEVGAWILENPVSGEDVASAILSLHENSARMSEISKKGPRLIEDRLNWSKESERLVKVYREIHGVESG